MRTSADIHTARVFAVPRYSDLLLAWSDAADDAHTAYLAWRDAAPADRDDGFAVFSAALDREEAAARALEAETTADA